MDSWQPQRNSNPCLNLERVVPRVSHRRRRLAGVRSVSRASRSTLLSPGGGAGERSNDILRTAISRKTLSSSARWCPASTATSQGRPTSASLATCSCVRPRSLRRSRRAIPMSLAVCTSISIPGGRPRGRMLSIANISSDVVVREHETECSRTATSASRRRVLMAHSGLSQPRGSRPGGLVQAPAPYRPPGPEFGHRVLYAPNPRLGGSSAARQALVTWPESKPEVCANVEPRPDVLPSRRTRRRSSPEGVGSFPSYLQRACYRPRASGFDRHKPGDQRERAWLPQSVPALSAGTV
jgi:hypothetical protein